MRVLPQMGLIAWDQYEDKYLREQLAGNFARLDRHNHSPGEGVQIPTAGIEEGAITDSKITDNTITKTKLATALQEELVPSAKSIIAIEQSRENTAYGLLSTPDEVSVVLPENGLVAIAYQATWKESVEKNGNAAIFIGSNQLKVYNYTSAAPITQESGHIGINTLPWEPLTTSATGLQTGSSTESYTGDVTTGQIVGLGQVGSGPAVPYGGVCYAFAAAGTYKISVQFKASSGNVKVKNRKLWAWVISF